METKNFLKPIYIPIVVKADNLASGGIGVRYGESNNQIGFKFILENLMVNLFQSR